MRFPFLPTRTLLLLLLVVAPLLMVATLWRGLLVLPVIYLVGLIVAVVLDARTAPQLADLTVEREHDERLSLGEANLVELRVRWDGLGGTARRLRVRDEIPAGLPSDHEPFAGAIAPGGEWSGRYHLHPRRRGEYRFGRVVLRVETERGLLIWQGARQPELPARVYPNILAVRRYELLARQGRLQEVGLRRTRLTGAGTEFERLREYQADDDYRRINWKATARRRQPVTMVYETERSQNLLVLLDSGRLMGTPIDDILKLDHSVNAALMLAYVAMEMGDRAGLVVFADRVEGFVPLGRGRRQFQLLLEALYRVPSLPTEADPVQALHFISRRQLKRSLVVMFTDLAEGVQPDALIAALGQLARRHLPVCVMVSNPDIVRLAALVPENSQQAYEKVVAQRLLDERHAIIERIQRQGALVLDVPAEQLTSGVINRYLEIKARTRL